jgi:hypothetical protein
VADIPDGRKREALALLPGLAEQMRAEYDRFNNEAQP